VRTAGRSKQVEFGRRPPGDVARGGKAERLGHLVMCGRKQGGSPGNRAVGRMTGRSTRYSASLQAERFFCDAVTAVGVNVRLR